MTAKIQPIENLTSDQWFIDQDDNQALSLRYTGEVFYDQTSELQRVRVINTYGYGKTLTIDNMFMTTEIDEYHYHEMISHPVILASGKIKKVLVIGGGDGGTIREVLKHPEIEQVTMVEIDANVVEASKLYLPELSQSFDDPKLNLIIGDGIEFIAKTAPESYDLIIVDGSDPAGPAKGLFSEEFYQNCYQGLTENGILITQGESPSFHQETFAELNACIKGIFGSEKVFTLLFHIPTYPSGLWSFQIASKGNIDPRNIDIEKVTQFTEKNSLHYYNQDVHKAAFALPNYVKKLLNEM